MLEQRHLCVGPWTWATPRELTALDATGWVRRIDMPQGGARLGFVRLVESGWRIPGAPRRLEVHETEDASLLMSVERGWLAIGRWRVADAESCCVAEIVGAHVLDERRARLATLWQEGPARHAIRRRGGAVLARLESTGDGMLVDFTECMDASPFLRMALLGACLVHERLPSRRNVG